MSSSVIGALRVNLGLDSAQFNKGAKGAGSSAGRMRKQFLAVTGVAVAMGGAIAAAALAGARGIDVAAKSARRLDASIGGFRAVELAADEAGVSLSSLTNDIQTMNRELSTVDVSGNARRALDGLGLSADAFNGLDVDEKLALIADRVKVLGLDAGQTTAILRDLGVRNREMALLVLQGGDALRGARTDVKDYGLAISQVDASRIEAANDALGRLSIVTQYAGQELALALVPAMGRMAEVMTESLRAGGLLRTVIDGLVSNLDVLSYSAGVAVTAFGVRYVGALALSTIGTFSLVGALAVLKKALISSGVGALVVGAGYLIAKFADLVKVTGSFGVAFDLVKNVAAEALGRVGLLMRALSLRFQSDWMDIKASVFEALQSSVVAFHTFASDVAGVAVGTVKGFRAAFGVLPEALGALMVRAANAIIDKINGMFSAVTSGLDRFLSGINNALGTDLALMGSTDLFARIGGGEAGAVAAGASVADAFSGAFRGAVDAASLGDAPDLFGDAVSQLRDDANLLNDVADIFGEGVRAPLESLDALKSKLVEVAATTDDAVAPIVALDDALDDVGGSAGSAARAGVALAQAKTEAQGFADAIKDAGLSAEEMGGAKAGILVGGIDGISDAWGNFIGSGFRNFRGLTDAIFDTFKTMLIKMAALAAKNRIMISLGMNGVAASGLTGGGGLLGSMGGTGGIVGALSGVGGVAAGMSGLAGGTGIMGGLGNTLAGTFGTGGGIGGLAGSIGGGAGLLSSIGAAIPLLGAVALAVSFFSKKVKVLDSGLKLTASGADLAINAFKDIETSRFFGLSKKRSTTTTAAAADIADPLRDAYDSIRGSVTNAAAVLGFGADAFEGFAHELMISTKGLSESEAAAEIEAQLAGLSDAFVLAGVPIGRLTLEGESATDALERLATGLTSINGAMQLLGQTALASSLQGAAAADRMIAAFGGLEGMAEGVGYYFENFYSLQEQASHASQQFRSGLSDLNIGNIPRTMDEFRSRVDALFAAGRNNAAAGLIALAPLFDQLTGLRDQIGDLAAASVDAARAAQAQLEAIQVAQRERLAALRADRGDLLFNLLPDGAQIDVLRDRIGSVFDGLSLDQPETTAGLRGVLAGLDLASDAGAAAFSALAEIVPAFERVLDADQLSAQAAIDAQESATAAFQAAVDDLRGAYNLDGTGFASEFEAKFADEIGNQGRHSQDVINAQNANAAQTMDILAKIHGELVKQGRTAKDALTSSLLN